LPLTGSPLVRIVKLVLISVVLLLVATFFGDYIYLRIRMMHAKPNDPVETITAPRLLAIDEKGNKTEYDIDPVQPQQTGVCVHSLYPQLGHAPCWYLKKKFAQPIPMSLFFPSKRAK
jgi:hypothetical protein